MNAENIYSHLHKEKEETKERKLAKRFLDADFIKSEIDCYYYFFLAGRLLFRLIQILLNIGNIFFFYENKHLIISRVSE